MMNIIPDSSTENLVSKRTDRVHFECDFLKSKNTDASYFAAGQWVVGKVIRMQTVKVQKACNIPSETLPSSTCRRHSWLGQMQ